MNDFLKRHLPYLLTALLFLPFSGCTPEDYDFIQEIEGPHVPVQAEEGAPYVNILSPAGQTTELSGQAATQPGGFSVLVTAPSAELDCDLAWSFTGRGTVIQFNLAADGTAAPDLVLSNDITQGFPFLAPTESGGCSSLPRTMTITESRAGILTGTYSGEFFYRDYDLPDTSSCSQLVSMGVYTIDFAVPHTICP